MRSPEEILGVTSSATEKEVRDAYRALARRWHPDRFTPGPERDWAQEHMIEINGAYSAMLKKARSADKSSDTQLDMARRLIDDGRLSSARELLMSMPTRCAEWNYLFGSLQMKLLDYNKAAIYLSVAAHQKPDSEKYARALSMARKKAAHRRFFGLGR